MIFLQLHLEILFRLARCLQSDGDRLPTSSSFVQTRSLMTSVLKNAVLQNCFSNPSIFYSETFFSFTYLYRGMLADSYVSV